MSNIKEQIAIKEILHLSSMLENIDDLLSVNSFKNKKIHTIEFEKAEVLSEIENKIKVLCKDINPFAIIEEDFNTLLLNECIEKDFKTAEVSIIQNITNENMAHVPYIKLEHILMNASDSTIDKMFESGFRFKQGDNDSDTEIDMIINNNIKFFKCLAIYQPDFDWSKKYSFTNEKDSSEKLLTLKEYLNLIDVENHERSKLVHFVHTKEIEQQYEILKSKITEKDSKPKFGKI